MSEFCGKYRAIVQNNSDPDGRGRVQVTCPAVFGSGVSGWCEPCLPVGTFAVPAVGTPVWLEFQQNDLKKGVWSGTWSSDGIDVVAHILDLEKRLANAESRIERLERRL